MTLLQKLARMEALTKELLQLMESIPEAGDEELTRQLAAKHEWWLDSVEDFGPTARMDAIRFTVQDVAEDMESLREDVEALEAP